MCESYDTSAKVTMGYCSINHTGFPRQACGVAQRLRCDVRWVIISNDYCHVDSSTRCWCLTYAHPQLKRCVFLFSTLQENSRSDRDL